MRISCSFFFNDTATTEIYTLSLHDALPICCGWAWRAAATKAGSQVSADRSPTPKRQCPASASRSEEHTSELQSHLNLVCRLLLEKKKTPSAISIFLLVISDFAWRLFSSAPI